MNNKIPRQQEPLYDMFQNIVAARRFTRYMSQSDFVSDERSVYAVAYALLMMSRASIRASHVQRSRELDRAIPWDTIRTVSRRLSHFYQSIDAKVLWRTVREDLPPIETELRRILGRGDSEGQEDEYIRLIVDRERLLTPKYLEKAVSPFATALAELQELIDSAKGREGHRIVVRSITNYSPISVSLEGAAEAATVVRDTVVGWRREHDKKLAGLVEREKETEIERQKAELLKIRAEAAKNRADAERIRAEAAKQIEESERQRLENERLRFELQRDKVNFALELLQKIAPTLSEPERITYVMRLLPTLETISSSPLQVAIEGL
jgi:uncharacterized protein with HEPN domain